MKRLLFFMLVAGAVIWGFGALEARAGQIDISPPGVPLDPNFVPQPNANFAIVGNLMFSNFNYIQATGDPPPGTGVTIQSFTSNPTNPGVTFIGPFNAGAGHTSDWVITYTVTALSGTISDAFLSFVGGVANQPPSLGSIIISESISDAATGAVLANMTASSPGSQSASATFAGVTSINVQKDIDVFGGSNGASLSIINQGFSSSVIPEPASMALLGIGISGLFALRRFFKRPPVA